MKQQITGITFIVMIAALSGRIQGAMIYSNDFESGVGSEWSHTNTSVTPIASRRFLGEFTNQQVTLSLSGLPSHSSLTIAFELFILKSWDGNFTASGDPFPDVWDLQVVGGPTLLHTTFAIVHEIPAAGHQAYPDAHPGGSHPSETGAAEVDTLGYIFHGSKTDAVYNLEFTLPHSMSDVTFQFSGIGLKSLRDESWGLDNVAVTADAQSTALAPEPSSLALLGMGAMTLLGCGWRGRWRRLSPRARGATVGRR